MFLNKNINATSSIIAISLMVVVVVFSILSFQLWFNQYSSSTFAQIESKNSYDEILTIEGVYQNLLYIKTTSPTYFNLLKISNVNGSTMCEIKDDLQTTWYDGTAMLLTFDNGSANNTNILGFSKYMNYLTNVGANYTQDNCINNGCLKFNGSTYIYSFDGGFTDITLFAWIKPDSNNSGQIFSYLGGGRRGGLIFTPILNISNNTIFFKNLNNNISLNQWTFIVGTHNYNENISKLYVNGNLVKNNSYNEPSTIYVNSLGAYFKGSIDEAGIYWKVISDSEVKILYESQKAKFYSQLLPIGVKEIYINDCNLENNTEYNIFGISKNNKIEETIIKK